MTEDAFFWFFMIYVLIFVLNNWEVKSQIRDLTRKINDLEDNL